MSRFSFLIACVAALASTSGCSIAQRMSAPSEIDELKRQYARPSEIPFPPDNPYSEEKRVLGKALFFDPRLSKNGTISCASCHNPALGWEDGLAVGRGHRSNELARHSSTILDIAWAAALFWDGRADSLEAQALVPLLGDAEMGMDEETVLARIKATRGYAPMFAAAFPGKPVSLATVAQALATFERTVVSSEAPFDRWVEGDERAIGDDAKRGFITFNTKANCAVCHSSWRFTNDGFQDIGLPGDDKGRGAEVSDVAELQHAFKSPTLRNISRRAPYMHDGSLPTLDAVIRHYENGFIRRESLSPDIHPFTLSDEERADLIAFLMTLTSDDPSTTIPVLPQ
jgi:cytochrome c peroxidase